MQDNQDMSDQQPDQNRPIYNPDGSPGPVFNPQSAQPAPSMPSHPPEQPPVAPRAPYLPPEQVNRPADLPAANTALVLGLVSLLGGSMCLVPLLASPVAWIAGAKARREIRASNGAWGGDGKAIAGMVMGIIGTVILLIGILLLTLLIVVIASDPTIREEFTRT